jgi:hypothetical protein
MAWSLTLVAVAAPLGAQEVDRGIGVVRVVDSLMGARSDTVSIMTAPGAVLVLAR